MGKIKGIISVALALMVIMGTPILSFAGNKLSEEETIEYEETHDQIVFDDLSVLVINEDEIIVDVDPTVSMFKKEKAKQEKEKYDCFVKENKNTTKALYEKFQSGENVCVMSYTELPVVAQEDHYERVPKNAKSETSTFGITANAGEVEWDADSSEAAKGKFTLTTMITRQGDGNPYLYKALTIGVWDTSISLLTGENKPADGWDYVLQSCPVITSGDEFVCDYNYKTDGSTSGKEGTHFIDTAGEDSWVVYSVKDDPIGLAQLSAFTLTQPFKAKATTSPKKIHSYYVHTWDSMSIDASATGSAGKSGGEPSFEVGMEFHLSKEKKWWQVHNAVEYNF